VLDTAERLRLRVAPEAAQLCRSTPGPAFGETLHPSHAAALTAITNGGSSRGLVATALGKAEKERLNRRMDDSRFAIFRPSIKAHQNLSSKKCKPWLLFHF